jgi:proteasome activator subunit 4
MIEGTLSERGWHWTGKIVEKSVSCLTSIYFTEMGMLEPTLLQDESEWSDCCDRTWVTKS